MRERFLVLDGLRGIGASMVFFYHVLDRPNLGGAGAYTYLWVDFFFVLSGFVLAHAYQDQLQEPGAFLGFVRERIIRLHPLILLSIIPGAIAILSAPYRKDPFPIGTVITGAIPFPALWAAPLPLFPFPLNGPTWSLFWELLVNIAFAAAAPWLRTRPLVVVVIAAAIAQMIATAYGKGHDGHLAIAGLRAASCFPLGVLLYRIHQSGRIDLGRFGWMALPLMLLAVVPNSGMQPLHETVARFVIFPFVVLAGADYESRFPRTCAFLGELSYPIYVLHVPLLYIAAVTMAAVGGPSNGLIHAAAVLPIIWAVWRFYDVPVRRWLRRRYGWRRLVRPAES